MLNRTFLLRNEFCYSEFEKLTPKEKEALFSILWEDCSQGRLTIDDFVLKEKYGVVQSCIEYLINRLTRIGVFNPIFPASPSQIDLFDCDYPLHPEV